MKKKEKIYKYFVSYVGFNNENIVSLGNCDVSRTIKISSLEHIKEIEEQLRKMHHVDCSKVIIQNYILMEEYYE